MKLNWLTACGCGAGCVRFQGTKKLTAEGKELNALVANAVKSVLNKNTRKRPRSQVTSAQKKSRNNSTLKTSRLGVNDKQHSLHGVLMRKPWKKAWRRKRDYTR